ARPHAASRQTTKEEPVSRATQLAKEEADRVEAEEAEAEETEETATETEPSEEPAPPADEPDIEALATVNELHAQNVQGALAADFAAFPPSPLCDGGPAGYVPPFSVFPDEIAAAKGSAVFEYFEGLAEIGPPYKVAKTMQMCEACDGWGRVISGAKQES